MLPSLTLLPIPVDHLQVLDQMQPPPMPLFPLLSPRMLEDRQVDWHHKQRDELLLLVLLSLLMLLDIDPGVGSTNGIGIGTGTGSSIGSTE